MAAISDGVGHAATPTGITGRRDVAVSPPPSPRSGRDLPVDTSTAGTGRFSDWGRLYEARGREWAEAVRVRNLDRKLGRLVDQISDVKIRLEQVKLYPPYPVNESRRAEAIREFNGIAAEVKKMVPSPQPTELPALTLTATTAEADSALSALDRAEGAVAAQRTELVEAAASPGENVAAASSAGIRSVLSTVPSPGITRSGNDLLRQF